MEYLAGAKSAGQVAGRTIALLMMAVYAKEDAVANSNRACHTVTVQSALPWAGDVAELLDELAAEKLPARLMDPVLSTRRAAHAERRAAATAKAEALQRVGELEARIEDLTGDELDELERVGRLAHGAYTVASHTLREKVRARRSALSTATTQPDNDVDVDDSADADTGASDSDVGLGDVDEPRAEDAGDLGDGDGERVAQ